MTLIVGSSRYKIDFTFVLTVILMLLLCHEETVILSLGSSLLHEMGHLLFMYIFRQKVESVTLGCYGMRIERCHHSTLSYKKEAIIALGGIIINFIVAILGILYYYLRCNTFAIRLVAVNIVIGLFNMLPIEVLDMGRALRYILLSFYDESFTYRLLGIISALTVNLLAVVTVYYTAFFNVNISLIAVTVYLYVITLFKKWS